MLDKTSLESVPSRLKENLAEGVDLPPLGLSNRVATDEQSGDTANTDTSIPDEEVLSSRTLWPEIDKIYAHGYEIVCVAASPDGKYLASSCRATSEKHAVIHVHDLATNAACGMPLQGHSSTVTRISWQGSERMVSVGRDRSWRTWRLQDGSFVQERSMVKAHARIIWDVTWMDMQDAFITASRDKTVRCFYKLAENAHSIPIV